MSQLQNAQSTAAAPGHAAVDGMFAGVGAGLAMAVYLAAAGWVLGEAPGAMLARFDPTAGGSPLFGVVAHLAVAGVYGLLFSLAWSGLHRLLPRLPGLSAALAYSLLLYALAQFVVLPGPGAALAPVAPFNLLAAHLVYGLVLCLILRRPAQ